MDARTINYLRSLFRTYYSRHGSRLLLPSDIAAREVAAQLWGVKGYVRHLAFSDKNSIVRWASDKAPRHFYYSSAVYRYPSMQDMEAKGWIGADLIFDIDADHLPGCEDKVVEVVDEKIGVKASFAPNECIERAAWETLKLYDILVYELGFEKGRIRVEFSGHRGFHVHVDCKGLDECFTSDSQVRREITDYIRGASLDPALILSDLGNVASGGRGRRKTRILPLPPRVTDGGVRGRIARIAAKIAKRKGDTAVYRALTSKDAFESASLYAKHRELIDDYLNAALDEAKVEIDPQVTLDVKRLVRIPYSLHGKTGLVVKPVDIRELEKGFGLTNSYSPFNNLGRIVIRALVDTPVIEVLGDKVRLRAGEIYRLDAPTAIYLLCKEVAVLGDTGE